MSTFQGKMAEFPEISVDRFDGNNRTSLAFFLSHCHYDHMKGLDNFYFQRDLVENNRFIYVSHISAEILKREHPRISENLVELDLYSSTTISVGEKYISVTPIPAGHCPGSVMFLFEGEKTVLYTGDYRINCKDIPKIKAFYNTVGIKKNVDAVYLDTTFFLKDYSWLPSRANSLEEICNIIKEWIGKSEKHVINLQTSARYGYEYLFMEIFKEMKMPIHVNNEIYQFYSHVPELDEAVTRCEENTKIHSACGSHYTTICRNTVAFKVKTIKVSAFRWTKNEIQNGITSDNYYTAYVCYSTHASYEEGMALLNFLKPKKIEPNVLHQQENKNNEIYKNIEEFLDKDETNQDEPILCKRVKLFDIKQEQKQSKPNTSSMNSILDSPPRSP